MLGVYLPFVVLYSFSISISSLDKIISLKLKSKLRVKSEDKKPTNLIPGAVALLKPVTNVPSSVTDTGVVVPELLERPLILTLPLMSSSFVGLVVPIPTCEKIKNGKTKSNNTIFFGFMIKYLVNKD